MSALSHTPGPWYAEKSSEDFWYITMDENAFGRAIGQTWNAGKGKDCQEANARVMAAGPELLEVARMIQKAGDDMIPTFQGPIYRAAKPTIAKAEGGS